MARSSPNLTLRRHGQITLPAEVRRRVGASEGDAFVAEVRDADQIVLRKKSLVDASQSYFWTVEWPRGEREAQSLDGNDLDDAVKRCEVAGIARE